MKLSVENVTKKYRNFTALEDVSIDFEEGIHGLLSPNGAGKTTLIKMLTTLLFPTKGRILLDGQDILELGAAYRGMFGYLPQDFGFYRNYSPMQFLKYIGALQGMDRRYAEERAAKMLDLVNLSDSADVKMRKFSGGMIRRVGIAQAMIADPKILILDEPTAGLDPGERVRFRSLLHSLSRDRIVILSTHIVSDLDSVAGRILMLKDHRLFLDESPSRLRQRYEGKIFEVPAAQRGLVRGQVLAETENEGESMLRVAAEVCPEGARPVKPTLEDVYLCIYEQEDLS